MWKYRRAVACLAFITCFTADLALSKSKTVSSAEIEKLIAAIAPVSPWPSKSAWVRYDTLSSPTPGQLVGRFASSFDEACSNKTPFTSFPRDGWQSPVHGQYCKDGSLALNPILAK
jgi:hypothetical protein